MRLIGHVTFPFGHLVGYLVLETSGTYESTITQLTDRRDSPFPLAETKLEVVLYLNVYSCL